MRTRSSVARVVLLIVDGGHTRVDLQSDCPQDGGGEGLDSKAGPVAHLEDHGGCVEEDLVEGEDEV